MLSLSNWEATASLAAFQGSGARGRTTYVGLRGPREAPMIKSFDRLIIGEAHPDAAAATDAIENDMQGVGMNIERYVPIMDLALESHRPDPPAGGGDVSPRRGPRRGGCRSRALETNDAGHCPGLRRDPPGGPYDPPRGLNIMRWIPAALGAIRNCDLAAE